jgi:predicted nucleic acid-binding protein
MTSMVVDASTAISFLLKDELSSYALKAVASLRVAPSVYVPSHFWLEISNGLLMAERRKRASWSEISETIRFAFGLPYMTDEETARRCKGESFHLARQFKLTIYDAAYLELALRRRLTLATVDKALARAAKASGVRILT